MSDIKKVYIACIDDDTKKIVLKACCRVFGEKNVIECQKDSELYEMTRYAKDSAVIFDKFFFGYKISKRFLRLRCLNPDLLTYFIEIGECSDYFGMRVKLLSATGYIPEIEREELFIEALKNIQAGNEMFPVDKVIKPLNGTLPKSEERCVAEVTDKEMSVGIYLALGKTQKDIGTLLNAESSCVCLHIHRLKRKIGYKQPSDLTILNKRTYFWGEENGGGFFDCQD